MSTEIKPSKWYLGVLNDASFIINTPPRPSTDDMVHDRPDGPDMVFLVDQLPADVQKAIVDRHNAELSELGRRNLNQYLELKKKLTDAENQRDKATDQGIALTIINGKLRSDIQEMVKKAAEGTLDGYRELAQRANRAEAQLAQAHLKIRELMDDRR